MQRAYAWCRASHEDQRTQVRSTLVAQGTSGVDQSTNTIRLNCASDEG